MIVENTYTIRRGTPVILAIKRQEEINRKYELCVSCEYCGNHIKRGQSYYNIITSSEIQGGAYAITRCKKCFKFMEMSYLQRYSKTSWWKIVMYVLIVLIILLLVAFVGESGPVGNELICIVLASCGPIGVACMLISDYTF